MATSNGPDLSFAQAQVERLMDDTCTVVRPLVLTAEAVEVAPEIVPITKCSIRARSDGRATAVSDGGDEYMYTDSVSLPIDDETDQVQEGDVVIVRTSRRDPTLPGRVYVVRGVDRKTFLVSRRCALERFESAGVAPDEYPEDVTP